MRKDYLEGVDFSPLFEALHNKHVESDHLTEEELQLTYVLEFLKVLTKKHFRGIDEQLQEDIAHSAMLKFLIALEHKRYEEQGNILGFLASITFGVIIDFRRKDRIYSTFYESTPPTGEDSTLEDWDRYIPQDNGSLPEALAERSEFFRNVQVAFSQLNEGQQTLAYHAFYLKYSHKDLADLFKTSEGAIKIRLWRIRKRLSKFRSRL